MPTPILAAHDAFRHRGLGATSYQLYALLREAGSLSSEALAERSGKHRSTVKRKLEELAAHGLATQLDDGSWRAVARDLNDVAKGLPVAGIGEQARRKHAEERATYARARSNRGTHQSVAEAR
jgi:predicted transcriptional regulator